MEIADPGDRRHRQEGQGRLTAAGSPDATPDTTIVALSSGAPPAAIGIVRVSGPAAIEAVTALAGALPAPRVAGLRALRDGDGMLLDRALVLVFPGPTSATGEDLVEIHCHGGRAVVAAIEAALLARSTLRAARPGEFTRRALENGRIDLAEARGLADLLEAETEIQRRVAIMAAEGQVGRAVRGWLDRLSAMAAEVEASIDYAEEGDVEREARSLAAVDRDCRALAVEIGAVLAAPPVERWRDGIRIVVAGPPNAGKSTLVNLLSARDAAITSPIAGTTRDRIEVPVRRDGIAYVLVDTAGIHEAANDLVELAGICLARRSIEAADLVLWVADCPPSDFPVETLHIFAKADLPGRERAPPLTMAVSRADGATIEGLWRSIAHRTACSLSLDRIALHRQERDAGIVAHRALERPAGGDAVLIAENLRTASRALATIVGIDATEAMLDHLFGKFCVGK